MTKYICLVVFLSGCAAPTQFYAGVGVGYKVHSDWQLQPEHAGGDNPTAHFRLGVAWENGLHCGAYHWSHWVSGGPFNNRPETYNNELLCEKIWHWRIP